MQLKDAIHKRKSVKRFSSKKPNWKKIIRALDYSRFISLPGNIYATGYILVSDKKNIEKISKACQQDFIQEAQYVVVFATNDKKIERSFGDKAKIYARQQAGAGIQNFLLGLTEVGLRTCWVGHFDETPIKKILEIPEDHTIEAVFPIGKETKIKTSQKKKTEFENVMFFEKWKERKWSEISRVRLENS